MFDDDPRRPNPGLAPLLMWGIAAVLAIAGFVLLLGVLHPRG